MDLESRKTIVEPVRKEYNARKRIKTPIRRDNIVRPPSHMKYNIKAKQAIRRPRTSFADEQIGSFAGTENRLMKKIRYQEHHNTELDKQIRRVHHNVQKALKTMDRLARKDHIDGRNAFSNKRNRVLTRIRILETAVDDKKTARSNVEAYNRALVSKIDELRKGIGNLQWNFHDTKKKLTKYRNLIEDQMAKANRIYDIHGKAKEKLEVVQEQFYLETKDYESSFNGLVTFVENAKLKQEEGIVQERRAILRAKFEHMKETISASNSRGMLTDEEENAIKERLANLKAQLNGSDKSERDKKRKIQSMEHAFALLNAVLEAEERNMSSMSMKKHVEKERTLFEKNKNPPLSKSRINDIIDSFLQNEENLFNLGAVTREVKNELSSEKNILKNVRQQYKDFTEGGQQKSSMQKKFEQMNLKKDKIVVLRDKEKARHDKLQSTLHKFFDGFQTVTDSLGVFRSVNVPMMSKSASAVDDTGSDTKDDVGAGPAREKKGRLSIGPNNIMRLMGRLEMHATDLANNYLNHLARVKLEEEEALRNPNYNMDSSPLGVQKKRKIKIAKRPSIWGPTAIKNFNYTASPIRTSSSSKNHHKQQHSNNNNNNSNKSDMSLPPLTLEEKAESLLSNSLPAEFHDFDRPMSVSDSRKHLYRKRG